MPSSSVSTRSPRVLLASLVLALLVVVCPAGELPIFSVGVGARFDATPPPAEAHGWLVVNDPDGEDVLLVHLPPRRGSAQGEIAGQARRSRVLENRPLAMAAHARELVMVFEGMPRRVLSIRAEPSGLGGMWYDEPAGRMTPLPPLPGEGEIVGLAMPAGRPAALLRLPEGWRLLDLHGGEWTDHPAPPGLADDAEVSVFADGGSLIVVRSGASPAIFTRPDIESGWTERRLGLPASARPIGLIRGEVVALVPGASPDAGPTLVLAGEGEPSRLGEIDLPPSAGGGGPGVVVIPDESGRLAALWMTRDAEGEAGSTIREVSLSTGRVLYDGPVTRVLPVSAEEFRLLATWMIVVMVVSLFVVLRPGSGEHVIVIPPGTALAPPGQRFSATVLDAAFCALLVSIGSGVPFSEIVTGAVLVGPGLAWVTLPAVLMVGVVYGTVMDRLASGTLGKIVLGCRVIRGTQGPPGRGLRLGWGASLVRNVIKWALPPVAGLAMFDPSGRHRGDVEAGAIVVTRIAGPGRGSEPGDGPDETPDGNG